VKKEQHIGPPIQTTVINTMNIFWKFITDEQYQQPERQSRLSEAFEEDLSKYHKNVRSYMPDFMTVVVGREKPDLVKRFSAKLEELSNQEQKDSSIEHYRLLESSDETINRCLLSVKKLIGGSTRRQAAASANRERRR
jgi:Na+/phosphate symporter